MRTYLEALHEERRAAVLHDEPKSTLDAIDAEIARVEDAAGKRAEAVEQRSAAPRQRRSPRKAQG